MEESALSSHVEKLGLLPILNFHADGRKVRSERHVQNLSTI